MLRCSYYFFMPINLRMIKMTDITKSEQKVPEGLGTRILQSVYKKLVNVSPVAEFEPLNLPPDREPVEENKLKAECVFLGVQNGLYLKSIFNEAPYSKPNNILTYDEAIERSCVYDLPDTMDAPFECIDNREVGRVSHTIWILFYQDHNELVVPTPTTGRLSVGNDIIVVKDPADPMPEGVLYAIRVVLGTELVNNSLRGCRWSHFSKRM